MDVISVSQLIDGAIAICLSLLTCLSLQFVALVSQKVRKRTGVMWDGSTTVIECEEENCYNGRSFDEYTDILWTFLLILALSKLTQFSEWYFSQRLLKHKDYYNVSSMNREWEQTLQLHEQDKRQLDEEVQVLTEKNLNLELMIKDLRDCNIHLISENFMRSMLLEQKQQPVQPNIYITNSYFHLTRQVFINDAHVDLNVRNAGGEDQDLSPMESSEEGLNVWMQYLKMRKCYMGPIADPNLIAPTSTDHLMPIVMTTEQLAKLQGII
ncbi:uncharacterized protein LOC119557180 [Drosophila subpulchrella]|uniref:uncharacterized protein LOC119557180 n=1 Tax=Drosophila subpulchrella TaxID=1486046 RepID=UPI0018A16DD4|nr:uncharacterized protein LOC119557180 [Drosophila subpulchrella]